MRAFFSQLRLPHALAVSACFCALLVTYTLAFYYRFPYWDQLELTRYLELYLDGRLTVSHVFAPHAGSHWYVGARLVLIPLALATKWNTLWEVLLNLVLCLLTWGLLFHLLRRTAREIGQPSFLPWATVAVSFFMFSLGQAQNSLWGWQTAVYQNLLGVVAGIVLLTSPRVTPWRLLAAIAGGLLASYNFSTGLAFWPVGIFVTLTHPGLSRRRKTIHALILAGCAAAVVFHFHKTVLVAADRYEGLVLWRQLAYCCEYLGCSLVRYWRNPAVIAAFGAGGLAAFCSLIAILRRRHRHRWSQLMPYLALALFALGSAAATSFGRDYLAMQYLSFSNLFWMSLLVLAIMALGGPRPRWFRWAAAVALLVIVTFNCMNTIRISKRLARHALERRAAMVSLCNRFPDVSDAELRSVYPDSAELARSYLTFMAEHRLSLFKDLPRRPERDSRDAPR